MGIIVQKFGGTSVADTEKLFNVCRHIINEHKKSNKVVVVVSAQGKMTDKTIQIGKIGMISVMLSHHLRCRGKKRFSGTLMHLMSDLPDSVIRKGPIVKKDIRSMKSDHK